MLISFDAMSNKFFNKLHGSRALTRRSILYDGAVGFGFLGLAGLLAEELPPIVGSTQQNPMLARKPHFTPKAKRVIFLFMHGGP